MPNLALSPQWRALPGHAYGLPQPVLIGTVQVAGGGGADVRALDEVMTDLVAPPAVTAAGDEVGDPVMAFVERMAYWVGEVQRQAWMAVSPRVHVRDLEPGSAPRRFEVTLPVQRHRDAAAALEWVARAADKVLSGVSGDDALAALRTEFATLLEQLRARCEPGFNQTHLLLAAHRLEIPVQILGRGIVRLGSGARARLMQSSISDRTPALGMRLAQDKWLTCRVLRSIGLPATRNQRVASVEQALELARGWGWPVVIKPADQERGRGVAAHLMNEAALRDAYAAARTVSKDVLLERHVEGFGHRFTVHDGELVSVLRRVPGGVTGDGTRTVAELVRLQREADLRRSMNLGRIELDAEALSLLADCGLDAAHVPAPGGFVLLRRRDNIAAGGRLERLDPASVHPDNVRAALRAAQALHLDFAGIDFLSTDIAQSWRRNGAQICEVNARPQFGPGADGLNYDRVLQRLLGGQTRIPVHLLLCCDPSAPGLPGAVEALRRSLGLQSMACRRGVWVAGEPHAGRCRNGYSAAVAALGDREVSSLLFAMSPAEVLDLGLPTARVDAVHLEAGAWPETEAARRAEALARCACAKIHHAPNGLTPGACGRLEAASQPGALLILPR